MKKIEERRKERRGKTTNTKTTISMVTRVVIIIYIRTIIITADSEKINFTDNSKYSTPA